MTEHDNVRSGAIDANYSALARDKGGSIAVCQCKVNCIQPARPEEFFHICTSNTVLGGTTMWPNISSAAEAYIAHLTILVDCIGPTRHVVRFPKALSATFEQFHAVDALLA